jgi:hypothetical protein
MIRVSGSRKRDRRAGGSTLWGNAWPTTDKERQRRPLAFAHQLFELFDSGCVGEGGFVEFDLILVFESAQQLDAA